MQSSISARRPNALARSATKSEYASSEKSRPSAKSKVPSSSLISRLAQVLSPREYTKEGAAEGQAKARAFGEVLFLGLHGTGQNAWTRSPKSHQIAKKQAKPELLFGTRLKRERKRHGPCKEGPERRESAETGG